MSALDDLIASAKNTRYMDLINYYYCYYYCTGNIFPGAAELFLMVSRTHFVRPACQGSARCNARARPLNGLVKHPKPRARAS